MLRRTSLWLLFASLTAAHAALAQVELLPNLRPLPAIQPFLVPGFPSGVMLRFGTVTSNEGFGPAEIRGGLVIGDTQEVWQCVYTDAGQCTRYPAGTFIHHPEHGHIHFEDYALYTLEPLDETNPSSGAGNKVSFCLLDSEKIDGRLPGAPRKAAYTTCGAERQGISVGWSDLYQSNLPGQEIDVTGFPEGEYLLSIVVDPDNRLRELDDTDNTSSVRLYMNPATLTVQVLGEFDPAVVAVHSMAPAVMERGQSIEVTITGAGFDPGLLVSFTGASGAPKVSDVVLESSSTIRATVTAGTGGPRRQRTFDLQVGPALLPGALTVLP